MTAPENGWRAVCGGALNPGMKTLQFVTPLVPEGDSDSILAAKIFLLLCR
jgi:hypothetical protein